MCKVCRCTVGGRIGWTGTRSGTARRPGIPGTTTPDSQLKNDYFRAKGNNGKPIPDETWESAFIRFGMCIGHVRKLLKEVASYGDPVARHAFSSRENRYDERVTQEPIAPKLVIPEQRSFSAAVYAKSALAALPSLPPLQPLPILTGSSLPRRTPNDPPALVRPQLPPPPCRSCGHAGHEVRDCPALFFSDANNELHLQWKDSPMGQLWLQHGFQAYDAGVKLPGYETQHINRPQSEFKMSMLYPPKN